MLTDEMKEAIEKNLVFVATASSDGTPNVVPIGFTRPIDNKRILIVDVFMKKTLNNLEENPRVSLIVQNAKEHPYQFKGTAKVFKSGKFFEEAVEWAQNVMSEVEPKSAILVTIEEIYSVKPGPDAGKRIK
ncbi:MAG TPA: flavin-nucleotide-binding protein [Methanothermobacter sp.]|jgi:predicted pyridoxine 5'-phosphate oxidase superfamily flavin-nucleotide-binding protein|uniref:Pyridoxamine 5'-phosphate oxidase n=1 Tax=Methanothermobacter tenebrarum TaxID=680118 RepID=A0ABN6PBS7_9EURY|nr:pyridoxamine 5'-phosphate oxidase family protein [Methanothermobacter tenebrarum]MDD3455222.1 pyridoxamine 5'-phosphate oxidase family protein [Methanobacteriales archaeon]MDI6881665.1 pyridoxamine 5'-phosphate oxidase family protein [Methanothermobacter sp.]MDX9693124.1 pyridoxamine 5'-phosphate oxidase family protein [Methanothermobacter sp.]BDH79363.1 pyridoxamine 5'-phosphate oxidase [Methanothermobacter tenebrarum]HHW16115.1 flavin-nucleotide-binding protein [Methanothermobacter sp.]